MENKLFLLNQAYSLLSEHTPLKTDCGLLCGKACCKSNSVGNTENAGMLLLPGEENLLCDSFFTFSDSEEGKILTCDGSCNREMRPFSCRIFPYYARISKDGKITLKEDPRAFSVCPVSLRKKGTRSNIYFRRNAIRAVRILIRDEDFKRELIKTSEFCDGLYDFYRKVL